MPKLILLSGISGSGKTTYRNTIVEALPDITVISSDDMIEARASAAGKTYAEIWLEIHEEIDAIVQEQVRDAVHAGNDVIWDQTNLTPERRRQCLDFFDASYTTIGIGFEAPFGVILDRVSSRKIDTRKSIPLDVLHTQNADWRLPHFDEGFDHVFIMRFPGAQMIRVA